MKFPIIAPENECSMCTLELTEIAGPKNEESNVQPGTFDRLTAVVLSTAFYQSISRVFLLNYSRIASDPH